MVLIMALNEVGTFANIDASRYSTLELSIPDQHFEGLHSFSPLKAFFNLPKELKPLFFTGLKIARELLPTKIKEFAEENQMPPNSPIILEMAVDGIADDFIELFDPGYKQKMMDHQQIDSGVINLARIFKGMLNPYRADVLQDQLTKILQLISTQVPGL